MGFDSVWLADHLFLSIEKYGGPPGRHRAIDPLVGLAAVARAAPRVGIGTLVLCAQLRPPGVLAKALATLDVLSEGRLVVGVGAGWYEPEYRESGLAFEAPAVRLRQLEEAVTVLRGLFGGGPYSYSGQHFHLDAARCRPPAFQQPRPPIWVGGRGERLLDVVARCADGWNTVWAWTPEAYRERVGVLHAACERAGRDPAEVELSLGLTTLVGEDEADLARRFERLAGSAPSGVLDGVSLDDFRRGRLVGTPEEVGAQVHAWRELGVSTLVLGLAALPFGVVHADDMEMAAAATVGGR